MSKTDAGELLAGREVVQVFRPTGSCLEVISPVIATYRRQNAGCRGLLRARLGDGQSE